jgi:hypothetical protein
MLPRAPLLAVVSVLALGLAFSVPTPQTAWAAECGTGRDAIDHGVNLGAPGTPDDSGDGSNTACGSFAVANLSTSGTPFNSAYGNDAAAGDGSGGLGHNTAVGARAWAGFISGPTDGGEGNSAFGESARAGTFDAPLNFRDHNTAVGSHASAQLGSSSAFGHEAEATGAFSTAIGSQSRADDTFATAVGYESHAGAVGSSAFGRDAHADAPASTAIGSQSRADGAFSTAVGFSTSADFFRSTAIGVSATTTMSNQMMFGTRAETYVMPGITSPTSKSRQSGPLELVTTDAEGNLASDGGEIVDGLNQGVAIALALENPDLKGSETFGIAINGGYFEGEYAVAGAVMATLIESNGVRFSLAGGGGIAPESGQAGGRAGFQLTW